MIYVLIAIGVIVVVFIWWRYTSVARGMRRRDEKLLAELLPVARRLAANETVKPEEVAALSAQPQYRPMLYEMLRQMERLELFPREHLTIAAQGEGLLAHWMMHPNELQDAPQEIQLVEEVEREHEGRKLKYLVYRYRMAGGHWAEDCGWILGLAGPFAENDPPYSQASAFSRIGDKDGEVAPSQLVDWCMKTMPPITS